MIDMRHMHLKPIDVQQLVECDDLFGNGFRPAEEQGSAGRAIRASTAASDIGGQPRSRPILAKVRR